MQYITTQNKNKKLKLKPGLIGFYELRPVNGTGLFSPRGMHAPWAMFCLR